MSTENNKRFDELLKKVPKENQIFIKYSMALASQITKYLKEGGKNQKYLADKLDKSESEISKWLNGTHNLTLRTLAKIEAALGKELFTTFEDIGDYKEIALRNALSFQVKTDVTSGTERKLKQQSSRSVKIFYLNKYGSPSTSSTTESKTNKLIETKAI